MKVLLVIPPSPFLIDEKAMPFLGIMSVATTIKKHHYKVSLLDLSGHKDYFSDFMEHIKKESYDVIGFTVSTPQYPYVVEMARVIPRGIKKIIGGPHVTSCYAAYKHIKNERTLKNIADIEQEFDHIFVGDGEISIVEFLNGNITSKVIDADENNHLFLTNEDLAVQDFIDRSFIDLKSYHFLMGTEQCASIISQLGCPFSCSFCCGRSSKNMRRIRSRTILQVIKEIEYLYKTYGYQAYMFYDDELNINRSLLPLLTELIDLQKIMGVRFKFRSNIKSELFTDEQAYLMKQCGFECLLCGFESANDRILTSINKKATRSDNDNTISLCKKYGLKIKALMSCGHPGDSRDTILESQQWLIDKKVDEFSVSIITPYPGSPYYDFATPLYNDIWQYKSPHTNDMLYEINVDYSKLSQFYRGIPGKYKAYVHTDYISAPELVTMRDDFERNVKNGLNII